MNFRIPRFLIEESTWTTGKARLKIPEFFNTLLDSAKKSVNGLKCCEDSNETTRSTELSEKGNFVEVEFTNWSFPNLQNPNCL